MPKNHLQIDGSAPTPGGFELPDEWMQRYEARRAAYLHTQRVDSAVTMACAGFIIVLALIGAMALASIAVDLMGR